MLAVFVQIYPTDITLCKRWHHTVDCSCIFQKLVWASKALTIFRLYTVNYPVTVATQWCSLIWIANRDAKRGAKGALIPGPQGLEGPIRFQLVITCLWCSYKHRQFMTTVLATDKYTNKLRSSAYGILLSHHFVIFICTNYMLRPSSLLSLKFAILYSYV